MTTPYAPKSRQSLKGIYILELRETKRSGVGGEGRDAKEEILILLHIYIKN